METSTMITTRTYVLILQHLDIQRCWDASRNCRCERVFQSNNCNLIHFCYKLDALHLRNPNYERRTLWAASWFALYLNQIFRNDKNHMEKDEIPFDAKTGIPDAIMWLTFCERAKKKIWILFAIVCFADQNFANQRKAEIKNMKKGFFCVISARYLTFTCRRFTRTYIKYKK